MINSHIKHKMNKIWDELIENNHIQLQKDTTFQ